jgi:hypothetical protein
LIRALLVSGSKSNGGASQLIELAAKRGLSLLPDISLTKAGALATAAVLARQSPDFYGRRIQMRLGFRETLRVSLMMMYADAGPSRIQQRLTH